MTTLDLTPADKAHAIAQRLGPKWEPHVATKHTNGLEFWAQRELPNGGVLRITQNSRGSHYCEIQAAGTRITAMAATPYDALTICQQKFRTRVAKMQTAINDIDTL